MMFVAAPAADFGTSDKLPPCFMWELSEVSPQSVIDSSFTADPSEWTENCATILLRACGHLHVRAATVVADAVCKGVAQPGFFNIATKVDIIQDKPPPAILSTYNSPVPKTQRFVVTDTNAKYFASQIVNDLWMWLTNTAIFVEHPLLTYQSYGYTLHFACDVLYPTGQVCRRFTQSLRLSLGRYLQAGGGGGGA